MRWQEIRDVVIADGVEAVEAKYPDDDDLRRRGAIEGFEIAAQIEHPSGFRRVLEARRRRENRMVPSEGVRSVTQVESYWRHRHGTLQIGWVHECMKVVWGDSPVLGRAAIKVSEVYKALQAGEETQERPRT